MPMDTVGSKHTKAGDEEDGASSQTRRYVGLAHRKQDAARAS